MQFVLKKHRKIVKVHVFVKFQIRFWNFNNNNWVSVKRAIMLLYHDSSFAWILNKPISNLSRLVKNCSHSFQNMTSAVSTRLGLITRNLESLMWTVVETDWVVLLTKIQIVQTSKWCWAIEKRKRNLSVTFFLVLNYETNKPSFVTRCCLAPGGVSEACVHNCEYWMFRVRFSFGVLSWYGPRRWTLSNSCKISE